MSPHDHPNVPSASLLPSEVGLTYASNHCGSIDLP